MSISFWWLYVNVIVHSEEKKVAIHSAKCRNTTTHLSAPLPPATNPVVELGSHHHFERLANAGWCKNCKRRCHQIDCPVSAIYRWILDLLFFFLSFLLPPTLFFLKRNAWRKGGFYKWCNIRCLSCCMRWKPWQSFFFFFFCLSKQLWFPYSYLPILRHII